MNHHFQNINKLLGIIAIVDGLVKCKSIGAAFHCGKQGKLHVCKTLPLTAHLSFYGKHFVKNPVYNSF
jgi:hypothetical protein